MPPKGTTKSKSKDASLKEKVKNKRKNKAVTPYPAEKLSELKSRRGRLIAAQLGIPYYGKIPFKDELIPLIREKMLLIKDCLECGGQCIPDEHVFPEVAPVTSVSSDLDPEYVAPEESETGSDTSQTSEVLGDGTEAGGSPLRSVFNNLNGLNNPHDVTVPGAAPVQSFGEYVAEQQTLTGLNPGPSNSRTKPPSKDYSVLVLPC